jgi:D-alanine--poly(phosphoribitol) ligase subunit 1
MDGHYHYNLGLNFYSVAEKYAGKPALITEDGTHYSYKELNEKSNRIAGYLTKLGLKQGDVICLFNDRSFSGFCMMLACLKTGIIYANLDPASPVERLKRMLNTCNPKKVFNFYSADSIADSGCAADVIQLADIGIDHLIKRQRSLNFDSSEITGYSPAYLMFTSGSTGFPKGVIISHLNLINFITWVRETFDITSEDKFTNINPVYFDNSVFDFFGAVFNGAALCPILTKEPRNLIKKINDLKPTIWFSVPSLFNYLLITKSLSETDFACFRLIFFGGEGFPKAKLKMLSDIINNGKTRLINVYGPTECTCICSAYEVTDEDFEDMEGIPALGSIASNFGYLILDEDCHQHSTGELCLMGPQVGLGYFNDKERTSESFVQNPLNNSYSQTLYKTGDMVSLKDDGKLYFIGRKDNQVKHMGNRIELEEIEAAINCIKGTLESCVVYKKEAPGLGLLIAYVVSSLPVSNILSAIQKVLPTYMIPRRIVLLDSLPRNKNGKIDRQELITKSLSS